MFKSKYSNYFVCRY